MSSFGANVRRYVFSCNVSYTKIQPTSCLTQNMTGQSCLDILDSFMPGLLGHIYVLINPI